LSLRYDPLESLCHDCFVLDELSLAREMHAIQDFAPLNAPQISPAGAWGKLTRGTTSLVHGQARPMWKASFGDWPACSQASAASQGLKLKKASRRKLEGSGCHIPVECLPNGRSFEARILLQILHRERFGTSQKTRLTRNCLISLIFQPR
jgi:hypothetical protein